uniref:Innexin n=1 Tax=Panagrolaimus sp. ES5 TaxID=591445 RepID=A0AC34GXQ2_9BILA
MKKAILDFFEFLKFRHQDHDGVDNLNTRSVCIYAVAVGFLLFASEYGSHSIQCFPKASWRPGWKQYAEDLCFVEGTYFVDPHSNLPHWSELPDSGQKVKMYQWTPFVFLFIALMFHLPRVFWESITSTSYLYFHDICNSSMDYRDRAHTRALKRFSQVSTNNPALLPAHTGLDFLNRIFDHYIGNRYLIISYFFMKVWHIANVILAHLLLCLLLPDNFQEDPVDRWGYKTFWKILMGVDWKESGAFPRITTCEIATRQYSGARGDRIKHEQTQCFLAANNYIEKAFFVTWILFVFLLIANICSLGKWIWKIWFSKEYVQNFIRARISKDEKEEDLSEYANLILPDARFTILMVEAQTRKLVSAEDYTECYIEWKLHR